VIVSITDLPGLLWAFFRKLDNEAGM
jgi:hypothetical protein